MTPQEVDIYWLRRALDAAHHARTLQEVPVGAVLVQESKLIAWAGNRTRTDCDPTAHAEILVLRTAAQHLGDFRLTQATLYTTLEPCIMCAGALVQARIRRLVYGASDLRFGAVTSRFQLCDNSSLNHRMELTAGVLEEECRTLLQTFFRARRQARTDKRSESRL